jgi:hypothetical protein
MENKNTKRICLWSGPRNISTALMYSFAQRKDTQVFDEPLYAYYLSHSKACEYHPGAKKIVASMENSGEKVVEMMLGEHEKPVVFFKQMTHHLLDLDRSFMKNTINIILTRNPVEMLPSFAKEIESPIMQDVGYLAHIELLEYLRDNGSEPIVIDSTKLLLNPKKVLNQLCKLLDIPLDECMFQWKAEARIEDGIWAEYWYNSVHKSTGFMEYKPKTTPFPEKLKPLLAECLPYYEQLSKLAIE